MKFLTSFIIAGVIGAPLVSAQGGGCLPSCDITTDGTPWDYAYVRSNACNNRSPLGTLYNGDQVYNLGTNRFGCGYWYTKVWVPSINNVGWVASQFLDCGGNPPVPAAALANDVVDTNS